MVLEYLWLNTFYPFPYRHMGEEGCMLTMPRIPFRTGRKDCVPDQENLNNGRGYIASSKKHEVHPNPFMNGKELTEFMKVCISSANY